MRGPSRPLVGPGRFVVVVVVLLVAGFVGPVAAQGPRVDVTDLVVLDAVTRERPERCARPDPFAVAEAARGDRLGAELDAADLQLVEASRGRDAVLPLEGMAERGTQATLLWHDARGLQRELPLPDDDVARTLVLLDPARELEEAFLLDDALPVVTALLLSDDPDFLDDAALLLALGVDDPLAGDPRCG